MVKYFSTQSKKEVHFGDIITFVNSCETPFGKGQMSVDVTVTKSNIDILLKEGILYKQGSDKPTDYVWYFNNYAQRINKGNIFLEDEVFDSKSINFFGEKYGYNIILSIVLKEIADTLNTEYSEPISKGDFVYAISLINGKIAEVAKDRIVNYNNFTAFRTMEDAKFAKKVVTPLLMKMFPENYKN